ncbi:Ku protein [Geothrix sp. 21YS21S-4]|uniref:non-homologous end joining protein Ku n=1 Tax=Geothrix sp. 21YS21S-4 TaxID=3068889 RepID=UPI0027B8DB63|nr:Ku protein [Geothrix sp. 21YS21S-4]
MPARTAWKGAISFGLVHIPVSLQPASRESGIDFDWIDRRSHDPVGYKRINKRTGREVKPADVVRGVKQEAGDYVILSDEEIRAAYPRATQTIGIEQFVKAEEIPFFYLERPYAVLPAAKADKVYALLRDSMAALGVIGIARIVMHTKEHLCALIPDGSALMLNTLRWEEELRPLEEMEFPAPPKSAPRLKPAELTMARQLIKGMTGPWKPAAFTDRFAEAVQTLVARRAAAGELTEVRPLEEPATGTEAPDVDLADLLKRSLPRLGVRDAKAPAKKEKKPVKRKAS